MLHNLLRPVQSSISKIAGNIAPDEHI